MMTSNIYAATPNAVILNNLILVSLTIHSQQLNKLNWNASLL
jgi:hypothetical protein